MSGSVGGVNSNIALQAGVGVTPLQNPLDTMAKFQTIQNAQNQNALFQAQKASGQAYQSAIDPATGDFDPAKYRQLLAGSPNAAMAAGAGVESAQTQQVSQQGVALKNLRTQSDALDSLQSLNGGAGPTFSQVQNQVKMGLDQGWLQPHGAGSVLLGMPTGDDAQSMATRQHMIQTMGQQSASALERLQTTGGSPSSVTNGPQLQPGMTGGMLSPTPGAFTPAGAPITVGLPTAAGRLGIVSGPVGANGAPTTQTLGQNLTTRGLDQNGNPLPNPAFKNLPSGLRNPNALPSAGNTITTGMGPAASAEASTRGTQSAGAFQAYADDSAKAQTQNAILGNMLSDTGQFVTGPGADGIKQFQTVMQRLSPSLASSFGIDPKSVTANESFDKLAAQLNSGQGSDARLAISQAGSPHNTLSPAGVDQMLRQLQGNGDWAQAKATLAATYPDQTNRAAFENDVGKKLDPRTFQYARLTPQQKTDYFNNLANKPGFMKSYEYANTRGLFSATNGQ